MSSLSAKFKTNPFSRTSLTVFFVIFFFLIFGNSAILQVDDLVSVFAESRPYYQTCLMQVVFLQIG